MAKEQIPLPAPLVGASSAISSFCGLSVGRAAGCGG